MSYKREIRKLALAVDIEVCTCDLCGSRMLPEPLQIARSGQYGGTSSLGADWLVIGTTGREGWRRWGDTDVCPVCSRVFDELLAEIKTRRPTT